MGYLVVRLDDVNKPNGPATVEAVTDDYPALSGNSYKDPAIAIWQDDATVPIVVGDRVFQGTMAVMKVR